jgi:hypothetical protein
MSGSTILNSLVETTPSIANTILGILPGPYLRHPYGGAATLVVIWIVALGVAAGQTDGTKIARVLINIATIAVLASAALRQYVVFPSTRTAFSIIELGVTMVLQFSFTLVMPPTLAILVGMGVVLARVSGKRPTTADRGGVATDAHERARWIVTLHSSALDISRITGQIVLEVVRIACSTVSWSADERAVASNGAYLGTMFLLYVFVMLLVVDPITRSS